MPTTSGGRGGAGDGGRRPCWRCWRRWCSSAASARWTSGASASRGRRPRRSTRSTTITGWSREIQGRPRLEKPPLPRWTIAALMALTGRRDEWIVRLPGALSALGMVGLVYGLGCRLGGRSVGLSAGLVLTSFGFFVAELRQAGNDGPLAFFTTLALYAAWRRLDVDEADGRRTRRRWNLALLRRARARVPEQGADHRPDRGSDGRALPGVRRPAPGRARAAGRRPGRGAVPAAGVELAGAGPDRRPERRGRSGCWRWARRPARRGSRTPTTGGFRGGRLALDDRALGVGRDARPGAAVPRARAGARRPLVVPLVVGGGQPGDVLPLVGRQAELLPALPARRGAALRGRMGRG